MFNRFWIHSGSQNWSKMTPKVIQKTYTKIKRNFIEKLTKNGSKIGAQGGSNEPAFRSLDPSWGHPAAQRDPTVPKGRPWEAKWRPRSSKMEPKWSPKGAKWRENGAPSEPKLIKHSVKNKAVECDGDLCLGMASTRFLMDVHWISNGLY